MNDFTKDELKQICQFFNIAIEDFQEPESTYDLRDKIQSMIDNYCEHEWHPGGNRPWLHCIKCKANFDHEPYPN